MKKQTAGVVLSKREFIIHLRKDERKKIAKEFGLSDNQAYHYIWNFNYYCTPEEGRSRDVYKLGLDRKDKNFNSETGRFKKWGWKHTRKKRKNTGTLTS